MVSSEILDWYMARYPFVHKDGKITNIDVAIASKMAGLKIICGKNGILTFREMRPGRCIYCGGTKCTQYPPWISREGPSKGLEIYTCRRKIFNGKRFFRLLNPILYASYRSAKRNNFTVCPRCHSRRFVIEEHRLDTGLFVMAIFECRTCRFTGSTFWVTPSGKKWLLSIFNRPTES